MTDWPFEPHLPFKYGVIMADPPWRYENWSPAGEAKNPKAQYECMPTEELKAMPVSHLASDTCLLFLWATFPMLPDALEVMEAWGFSYVTGGAWHKRTKRGKSAFGTGYVLRSAAEPFLIGRIGRPDYGSKSERNVIFANAREHSRKPDRAYALLERLCLRTFKLDLFSCQQRPGWDAWGDQMDKFPGIAA